VAIKAPPRLIPACQAAIIIARGIMTMVPQRALPEVAEVTSSLTKIRGTARNTISNHMTNRGERASKITSNSHTPQVKGKIKITIMMMEVSTINTNIKTMAESTVLLHNMILTSRKAKTTKLLPKLIKMKLFKKLQIPPLLKLKIHSRKKRVRRRIKSSSQYNNKVL
jgi:hypothetical protein